MSERSEKANKIIFEVPMFNNYERPDGFLCPHDSACHGLFYYYINASKAYKDIICDPMVYEGDEDPNVNFKELFISISVMYGVEPEVMAKHWHCIDMQVKLLGESMIILPDEERYRFNNPLKVN